jgi:hypothetical protein
MKRDVRPVFQILAFIAFAGVLIALLLPHHGPSWPVQREKQRQIVGGRIESLGWEELHSQCQVLVDNGSNQFFWPQNGFSALSNLPPAIARLNPREVKAYAAPGEPPIVRIKLFGMHSTGGTSTPYYGLWIVCGSATNGFVPKLDFGGNTVTGKISLITNAVFEVY